MAAILKFTCTRYIFNPEMIPMDSSTPKTKVKTPNLSLQDRSRWSYIGYKGAVAILDAILNYTFLPHIWNVHPSFFNLLWVPYKDHESKLEDISLHTGPPSAPGLTTQWLHNALDEHSFIPHIPKIFKNYFVGWTPAGWHATASKP